jgi:hypothetical protein
MNTNRYKLSYTGASLAVSESVALAETFLNLKDWDKVKEKVWEENLLKARTKSSVQRVYQEIWPRLHQLSEEQLELLVEGNLQEQKHLLWYAICKRYAFIREFAVEVIHEKYLSLDYELTEFDYRAFYNRKADWHPELDEITDTTQTKMRTRLFWMLQEIGIISDDHMIIPAQVSIRVTRLLATASPDYLRIFPATISSIG